MQRKIKKNSLFNRIVSTKRFKVLTRKKTESRLPGSNLLFGLLTTTALLWFIILKRILYLSLEQPSEYSLIVYGFIHYVILVLVITIAFILWTKTIEISHPSNGFYQYFYRGAIRVNSIVMLWWFPVAFISILLLLVSFIDGTNRNSSITKYTFLSLVAVIIFMPLYTPKNRTISTVIFMLCCAFFSLLYLLLMSMAFCDVNVQSDKKFYSAEDTIRISVRPSGYIFNPEIKNIYYGYDKSKQIGYGSGEYSFALSSFSNIGNYNSYLCIDYKPQIMTSIKTRYFRLKIVPKQANTEINSGYK